MKSFNNLNYTTLIPVKINYSNGIYLVKRTSQLLPNIIDHFGVMIVGRPLTMLGYSDDSPLVFHLTDAGFQVDWLETFGNPTVLGRVTLEQESHAIGRLKFSFQNLRSWNIGNNCEHFARYVTENFKQSIQLQNVGVLSGIALACILLRD